MSKLTDEAYWQIMAGDGIAGQAIVQHVTEFMQNLPVGQLATRGKYTKSGNVRKIGYVYSTHICDLWFRRKSDAIKMFSKN